MNVNRNNNAATFFFLYLAQSIPMSFFSTVIPVIMRQENFSLTQIGLLQLMKLPWILKFLWSPVIDRHSVSVTDYKRWIISSELVYAMIILSVAFLNFTTNFNLILFLIIISFVASATQDIATDALAALSFSKKDKSLINSVQSMGSFGGTLIGSGLLILLFREVGWNHILPYVALFVLIAVIPLYFNRSITVNKPADSSQRASIRDILLFFKQKGIWKQTGFLAIYYSSMIGTLAMMRPYLVDLGYDIKQIGFMNGIVGTATGLIAAAAGGVIIRKTGRYHARFIFSLFIVFTTFYFVFISRNPSPDIQLLYTGIILMWGSYGMASVIVYTLAMDCVRAGREGTDFTVQIVITHLSGIVVAAMSGKIADATNYHVLFLFEFALACLSLAYIIIIMQPKKHFKVIKFLSPYKGVLLFLGLLFLFHYLWKITVDNDGSEVAGWVMKIKEFFHITVTEPAPDRMYFLGKDVTPAWFHTAQEGLTTITAWFVRLLPSCRDLIQDSIVLYFPDPRITIKIVWGCLGVKQMSIFACVMLFYPGPFLKKLWYIPMGCVILTAYNVVRIGVSVIMTRNNPELFDSLHDGVLRYIYYTILFILWAVWAEYAEKRSDGK